MRSNTANSLIADSTALAAVWPRPQIDASRIAWRDLGDQRQLVCHAAARPLRGQPQQRLLLADGADPAGHALAARLVAEERRDPEQHRDEVDGVVEQHDHAGAERRTRRTRRLERELEVEAIGPDEAAGRAAEQDRLQLAAAGDAARQVDHLAQRDAERRLVEARPLDAAGEAEQPRPGGLLGADPGERVAARRARSRAR